MNIKQAKEYIKNSVNLYLKKNEFGEYRVPVVRQRPIFLLGAPGIGKTAIMEQIAQELGVALVSYSMTHHTRQSALGLPFITQKTYGGRQYQVSEYTMSEIIASIYDTMEESGIREGILFLDEINCVSETLAPSMLQFLQYKVFGRHQVPEGWVIVTAGNPAEYNKSVREFDVVTMDRLKLLEVEPDFRIWKEYARERRIHPAIVNFLDLKKEYFYRIEMTAAGRSYVTARGWEDLSQMLYLYEEEQLAAEESLVAQYIRNPRIVREFTAYYDLYNKYKKDYRINEILEGRAPVQAIAKAKEAAFDERLSLLGMLLDRVQADMNAVMEQAAFLKDLQICLK
ncbi:MAG: AAA family ATPase, partial [Acetatifactor sp.]|nr:AAA family ATPase [Acetatifactor sp.]